MTHASFSEQLLPHSFDSHISDYFRYRCIHAYLHRNNAPRRNVRVHDGYSVLPDYSSGFRLYAGSEEIY